MQTCVPSKYNMELISRSHALYVLVYIYVTILHVPSYVKYYSYFTLRTRTLSWKMNQSKAGLIVAPFAPMANKSKQGDVPAQLGARQQSDLPSISQIAREISIPRYHFDQMIYVEKTAKSYVEYQPC
jgi:hypothetical protein